MHPVKNVRIFVSSPDDVADDQAQARELLLGLAQGTLLRGRVNIELMAWNHSLGVSTIADMPLTLSFGESATPAECDLTVILLWTRMGGGNGREWEIETAVAAKKPVFVYRRTEKVPVELDDPELEDRLTQKRRVDKFFARFGEAYGAVLRPYRTYNSTPELLDQLRRDVEGYVSELVVQTAQRTELQARIGTNDQVENDRATTVFICYRREDSADAAGRLHDRLVDAYGRDRVFMDIDSIPAGIDFVEHVSEQIARCSAVLVVIGKQWLKAKDKGRRRRLDNENDFVRAEVAAALEQKIRVIPVLVQDAKMPTAADLPESISAFARRNAMELNASRWGTDVERLIKELNQVMKG